MNEISLDDNLVQSPDGSLIDLGTASKPVLLSEAAAGTRAEKYNYALGAKSPGADQLYQQIVAGQEDDFRQNVAIQEGLAVQQEKLNMTQELVRSKNGAPLSQEEFQTIQGLSRDEMKDPNTILEKMYAERVMSDSFYTAESGPIVAAKGDDEAETYKIMDTGEVIIRNTEAVKRWMEDSDIKWADTSTMGKAWDFVEGFIPGFSWYNQTAAIDGMDTGPFLLGDNLIAKAQYLWSLPPEEFAKKFKETADYISQSNQNDARAFAQAMISYGNTDAAWGNLQSGFDLADAFGVAKVVGGVARGARAGAKAAEAVAEGVARTEATQAPGMATPGTATVNDLAGGTGVNIREGGPVSAIPNKINDLSGGMGVNIPTVGPTQNIADARAAVQRTVRSLTSRSDVDVAEVLSATGQPNAAPVGAFKSLKGDISPPPGPAGEQLQMKGLLSHMPTYMDPQAIAKGSYRFTREQADRIVERVRESIGVSKKNIEQTDGLERLSDGAIWQAVQVATEQVKREFTAISNAIADVSINPAEFSKANTYSVNFDLKQTSNDLFKTKEQAEFYATKMYKLNDYSIEPQGNGYFLRVTRDIDETHPDVRAKLIDTQNTTPNSFASRFLGALRGATDKVSTRQTEARVKAVFGTQKDLSDWRKIIEPISDLQGDPLSKGSKERFLRFVQANSVKLRTDPVTGTPEKGEFYRSLGDFENEWYKSFNRWPEEKEAKAYFAYIAAYDHDYIRRNLDIYKFKARQNVSKFALDGGDGTAFEGKFVTDTFDRRNLQGSPNIALWDKKTKSATVIRKSDFKGRVDENGVKDSGYAERFDAMLKDGYQVIQIYDPYTRPLKDSTGVGDVINYVLTKDFKNQRLDFEQIPYKPGGHIAYDYREGIKQPKVQQVSARRIYFGDTTVRMTNTPAEAKLLVKGYETARQLLKNNDISGFTRFVSKNLPDDPTDLINQFKAGTLDIDMPFVHTSDGARSVDDMGVKNSLGFFEDPSNDFHNLSKGLATEFTGERSLGETPSVHNVGTESNPVFGFQPTKYIDPLDTINRAGAQLARNKYFNDYRTLSAESFVQEFSDLLTVSKEIAETNPIAAIMNKDVLNKNFADKEKLAAAKAMQTSVLQLLGTRTPIAEGIEGAKKSLYNSMYKNSEAAAELLDNHVLSSISDPTVFMRRVAFTLQMGFWNPQQFWKQSQGFLHSIAVAGPIHGGKGAAVYPHMRALLMSNGSDQMIASLGKKASVFGWKADDFAEMFKGMRQSGMTHIGGSHSWKDDLLEPKSFTGPVGKMLDKSTVFFNEGEKLNRMVGYASAYSEWRAANKLLPFDRRAQDAVLRRADVMNVNMTKAGDAAWQSGAANVPSQFYSYQLRLWEQFLGKQLTKGEKARAIGVYSAMYGVPVGVGGTLLPIRDWYSDIRKELLGKGLPDNPMYIDAMHQGMVGIVSSLIAGHDTSASQSYGPGSISFLQDALDGDHTFMQIMLGASGSMMGKFYDSAFPVFHSLKNIYQNGASEDNFQILGSDVIDVFRNIKSVNVGYNAWYGMNVGKMISKNKVRVDDVTTTDVILSTVFGVSPASMSDTFMMMKDEKSIREAKSLASRQSAQYTQQGLQAVIDGDDELATSFFKRAAIALDMAGMDPLEKMKAAEQAYKGHEDLYDKVNRRYQENVVRKNNPTGE